ncbi:unnamed protein product [Rhizophagus irregularis]|uniref:Uncharacterized protein n=1 Tax=Rhizophagus irregularis TaxID=588596 RepID=A0A2I1GST6_9GLOM|nr:hypothetical protein RhiirA4_465746 [Rhizophagus irregularis]CAB4426499.1 unnamed protein product [Rhizophagus irregularis]
MMFYIFPKEAKEFLLAGSVKDKDLVHQNLYSIEFLNTLTIWVWTGKFSSKFTWTEFRSAYEFSSNPDFCQNRFNSD